MRNLFLLIAILATSTAASAQCRCEADFEWLREAFEANDAGFEYIVERKGKSAYNLHNSLTLDKIRAAKTPTECTEAMREWLGFFRRGHIGLESLSATETAGQAAPETWNGDIEKFEKEVAAYNGDDPLQGVWEIEGADYRMGMVKEGDRHLGFVISSNEEAGWLPGQVRMKIDEGEVTYFTRARMVVRSGEPEILGRNFFRLRTGLVFRRVSPVMPTEPEIEGYVKALSAQAPYIEQLDPTTIYIRIQSFMPEHGEVIEKLVEENFEKLTSTENLIIDVRGNGGGSDRSFVPLLGLIYTTSIRMPNVSFRASEHNIARMEEIGAWGDFVEKMKAAPDEFVPLRDEDVAVATADTICRYPQKVGIIVDEECGSSTEQFLFYAKQSWKVKLFGVSTFGALDASNMLDVTSPDGRYRLHYTSSISDRIHGMAIDDIGFQPDFYLDPSIPRWRWVDHVKQTLNYE